MIPPRLASAFRKIEVMARVHGAAFIALMALTVADNYFNSGRHTDATLVILRQMRHSFG